MRLLNLIAASVALACGSVAQAQMEPVPDRQAGEGVGRFPG